MNILCNDLLRFFGNNKKYFSSVRIYINKNVI